MATIKLTDAKIKTLKPQDKVYRILDSDRLYIEVRPTGVKVWRFKFVFNSKESSMSLGEYPAISLADARLFREEMRAKIAKGIHPVEERKQLKQAEDEKRDDQKGWDHLDDTAHEIDCHTGLQNDEGCLMRQPSRLLNN